MSEEIDITKENITNVCEYKCSYDFNYPDTNLTAKNKGYTITLTNENDTSTPAIYNNDKYSVSEINIFSPSLHKYDGEKMVGEVIIRHTPQMGGKLLMVCVPLRESNGESSGGKLLGQVIEKISTNAPDKGEETIINIPTFTLQRIVPSKPFVVYTGSYGSSEEVNFVVFPKTGSIDMSSSAISKLQDMLTEFDLEMKGSELAINKKGANSKLKKQGIYIDCNPTGYYNTNDSEDTSTSSSSSSDENDSVSDSIKRIVQLVILILIIGSAFALMTIFYNWFGALKKVNGKGDDK